MGKLWSHQDEINVVQLKVDMENSFDKIRSNYGSAKTEEFKIPGKINKVCFVEQGYFKNNPGANKNDIGLCKSGHKDYEPMMCEFWDGESSENVFFKPSLETGIYVKDIRIGSGEGYQCFDVERGYITVKLVGLGDAVKIS